MNVVDFAIIGIVLVSVLFGLYKGFIASVFSLLAVILSLIVAYTAYPQLAKSLQDNESLVRTLIHYSDASSRIHDLDLAETSVANIPPEVLDEVLARANLPEPFGTFVRENVQNKVFASLGSQSISDYLNQTIIAVSINILCFLACFLVSFLVLSLLVHLIAYVFSLPVLKHFDMLLGGTFGAVRGLFFVFALFALIPIVLTISPIEVVGQWIEQSTLAGYFYKNNFITSIMQGVLF